MPTLKQQAAEKQAEAQKSLQCLLQPGSTAKTILRHVSRSGMSRSISVVIADEDHTWLVARALGEKIDRYGGITVAGCGMDMGFSLIFNLSRTLYPNGFMCISPEVYDGKCMCPSNDHSNDPQGNYRFKTHKEGGYAINQRWL